LNTQLSSNLQHGSFVVVRQTCADVNDRNITLLQVQQQAVDCVSMDHRQTVDIVHDKVVAVASKLLTLHIIHTAHETLRT